MYIVDGIAYAGNPVENIEVAEVQPMEDMIMLLTFNNGEKRLFDATLLEGTAFEPLKNPEIFKNAVVEYGTVTWDNGEIDCSAEYMYQNSFKYSAVI